MLQAELADVAGEIAKLRGQLASGTPREIVALRWGLTPAEAGRTVRLGERLSALPAIRDAFAAGELSESTADTLVRVATPENEDRMLATARVASGAQLQRLVRHHRDLTTDPDAPPPQDSVRGYYDDRGRYRLTGTMNPIDGATVDTALDAARDRDRADHGGGDPLSYADALARVAEAYLTSTATQEGIIPERFHTLVLLDSDGASVADGTSLDDSLASEVLCSSWLSALVSKHGTPVTATSKTRLATPAQQRALFARYRCCAWPGCGRTRHLRAHHIAHHAKGGPTQYDNLAPFCPVHHRRIHQLDYAITRQPDGGLEIRDARGHLIRPPNRSTAPIEPNADANAEPHPPPRPPASGDRLTEFGTDVILHEWLEPPAA
jgi:hypothetical protein